MVRYRRQRTRPATHSVDSSCFGRDGEMIPQSCFLIPVVLFATSMGSQTPAPVVKADTIYVHANIYTGVAGGSSFHEIQRAQALAVRGDRILAVGREADILKLKGPAKTAICLNGPFVLPCFYYPHRPLTHAGV